SILSWEGTDELARRRVGGSINEIQIPEQTNAKINYLLDGQQRTSSLMLVFTDKKVFKRKNTRKIEKINLYFDSEYEGEDPELRFIFDDESIIDNGQKITLNYFSCDELMTKFGTRFISLKDVYKDAVDSKFFDDITQKLDDKIAISYYKKLRDLRDKILNRKVVNINQPGDLQSVLNIFERINTQNTKLNIFDIMVAKTYKKIENEFFDLRSFFKILNYDGKISSNYIENKNNLEIESVETNKYLDEATQLFLVMEILKQKFKQKEILNLQTSDLIDNLKPLHKTYWKVIRFMENKFKIKKEELKSYRPILKFLTIYIAKNPDLSIEQEELLNKWFWNTILYNRYPGAQNERVERDYKVIQGKELSNALDIFKNERTRHFNNKYFDAYYKSRSQLFESISLLFINNNAKDFYNGIIALKKTNSDDKLNEHHIFPTNSKIGKKIIEDTTGTDNEEILDNIANIAFITNRTNNKKINNKEPSEYILEFEEEYKESGIEKQFYNIMESQFISKEMIQDLKEDKFWDFIEKRTNLIKEKINELCGE
ncbi:MAG: DUF262 domain-containing protein, partial [Gammaproteobacteria bacterium]|nr:DUF262 domain-containing protein [Gammaproteobacteria bacterium]